MKAFITLFFMIISLLVTAQEKTTATESKKITGVITDNEDIPIPGVRVILEGISEEVFSDFDGIYTINAKEGEKLVASYVGMFDETITINKQNKIDFKLRENPSEIVWNGNCYRPYTKTKLTSEPHAIKSISALWEENIECTDMLKNGVTTSALPETKPIEIRCLGSISGDPETLYVIDGVPLNVENFKQLNPADIINISVLKNAENTSVIGCRRTGDVIIVKTKNGLTKKEKRKLKREQKNWKKNRKQQPTKKL